VAETAIQPDGFKLQLTQMFLLTNMGKMMIVDDPIYPVRKLRHLWPG
jgi:hypothetical protein